MCVKQHEKCGKNMENLLESVIQKTESTFILNYEDVFFSLIHDYKGVYVKEE